MNPYERLEGNFQPQMPRTPEFDPAQKSEPPNFPDHLESRELFGQALAQALPQAGGALAQSIVFEVRRQFREIPGILEGKGKPEYGKCVDIVTVTALRQLAVPAIIGVATPLAVGFVLGPLALAGLLLGVILAGFPLAIMMTVGGGAWDNAKKFIESGNFGGKHSDAHKAAVVGDTVGDATKDTAGPAINPLIKVVNTISILFVALIVAHSVIHIHF